MKREVAEERMSRYLDGDLNGEDTKELFRYMDEHPDAAETFRMMTALSLRLEKLPDVKPRYSLVDAILPQLDELDAQRRTESAAEIGIMERQPHDTDEVAERRRQRSNWRDRLPVRTIGGIVAAGVVLGISIASYEPKTLTDAGPEASPYRYNETGSIGNKDNVNTNPEQSSSPEASNSSSSKEPKDKQKDSSNATDPESSSNEPSDGQTSTATPDSSKADGQQQQENSTKSPPPQSESTSSSTSNNKGQQAPSSGNRGGIPSTVDKGNSSSTNKGGTTGTTPDKQTDKGTAPAATPGNDGSDKVRALNAPDASATDPESSTSSEGTGSTDSSTMTPSTTTPNQLVPESSPEASGTTTPPTDSSSSTGSSGTSSTGTGAGSASVNSSKIEQEWKSPSQDYTVVLMTNNTLRLDSIAADNVNGRSVVSSIPLKGTWLGGKWSDDGKVFTYQVNESGINKTYKITVGN
ncbi:hypothetical protein [Paenibacillus campi]|uniref:anti-sigma factor family protein n=1 Tax=Paenibacillus campi TaxID=3106031 RepID=UPI002B000953|nr:hypothetical protein [Paenibacillus sp. SGZ-1014]